jgi:hypothetical protein
MDNARLERMIAPDATRHVAPRASTAVQKRLKLLAGPMDARRRPISADAKRAIRLTEPTSAARKVHAKQR